MPRYTALLVTPRLASAALALPGEAGAATFCVQALRCVAVLLHGGRTTQVWDATVTRESDGRTIAHFRCTQYLLANQR